MGVFYTLCPYNALFWGSTAYRNLFLGCLACLLDTLSQLLDIVLFFCYKSYPLPLLWRMPDSCAAPPPFSSPQWTRAELSNRALVPERSPQTRYILTGL